MKSDQLSEDISMHDQSITRYSTFETKVEVWIIKRIIKWITRITRVFKCKDFSTFFKSSNIHLLKIIR